jgi:hypothetical protein
MMSRISKDCLIRDGCTESGLERYRLPQLDLVFVKIPAGIYRIGTTEDERRLLRSIGESRNWIGLECRPSSDGLLITAVVEDGPAYNAGLRPGDRLTDLNGTALNTVNDLINVVACHLPGEAVIFHRPTDTIEDEVKVIIADAREKENFDKDENARDVLLNAYLISDAPVTQAQWTHVIGHNPSHNVGDDRPVDSVSWIDAVDFCNRIGLRLPGEAEWEAACRAGNLSLFFWGSDWKRHVDYAWSAINSDGHSQPVRLKRPNDFGLYDMTGNVWEWCADPLCIQPGAPAGKDEELSEETITSRVIRGGSYHFSPAYYFRSAYRSGYRQCDSNVGLGFRCILSEDGVHSNTCK